MKRVGPIILVCALSAALAAQKKKSSVAPAAAPSAAKLCDDPYQVGQATDSWPEAPVYILFHRAKSKAPWARNPAIRVPGVETVAPASARTLVCVEESQIEMGRYESGEPGYSPSWDITLVRLSDRKVYFMRGGFYGKEPPGIKYHRGAGVGAAPTKIFADWLPLVVNQKVALLKTRLKLKEFHEVSAMVFSGDGTRLVVTQEPRSTLDGTPPSPVTVVDVSTGKIVASWKIPYLQRGLAISQSGNMVALANSGHPEIWDVASAQPVHKIAGSGADFLVFGPGDTLGTASGGKAAVWDVQNERLLHSANGTRVALSSTGEWLAINADAKSITVQALESGRTLATFPRVGEQDQYNVSGDAQAMARSSVLGATMYTAGNGSGHSLSLPSLGVGLLSAIAPTRDGFVLANNDGVVGVASASSPEPRVFATDHSAIRALAVSPDGKLLAVGDSFGHVTVWELQ